MRGKRIGIAVVALGIAAAVVCTSQGAATAATPSGVQKASKRVAAASVRPTSIGITTKVDGAIPKNITIDDIFVNVPAGTALTPTLKEAAKVLGWKINMINGGTSPESYKNAWDQVVAQSPPPSAVISGGFPRSIFESEIQALSAKNIPIVLSNINDPAGKGVTAVVSSGTTRNPPVGALQADWVIADSKGKANTVFAYTPAFPSQVTQLAGFRAEYAGLCPKCQQSSLQISAEAIGTTFPQSLVSYLQAHPNVNSVVLAYSDDAIGVPAAMANIGLTNKIRMITDDPSTTVASYVKQDKVVNAATAYPGDEVQWKMMDILLRTFDHEPIAPSADAPLPKWILTSKNIPSTTHLFPVVANYQAQYKALWGIK